MGARLARRDCKDTPPAGLQYAKLAQNINTILIKRGAAMLDAASETRFATTWQR